MNLFFAIFEVAALVFLFHVPLLPPHSPLLFIVLLINGMFISYFISLLLSFIAFWTTETWGPQFLFYMLLFFLSGSFFPLDILPRSIYTLLLLTPFPYLFYLPTAVLIGKVAPTTIFEVSMSFFWVAATWGVAKLVWRQGTKSFSFWGR